MNPSSPRWFSLVLICIVSACIEPYPPPVSDGNIDIMVVDGFLDMTSQTASVDLSRAFPLASKDPAPRIDDATVEVHNDKGQRFPLAAFNKGRYRSALPLDTDTKYSLYVRRSDGREYLSDDIALRTTPEIDSVTWAFDGVDILFYVYVHDPTNASKYFRWDFNETYEYTSSFYTDWKAAKGWYELRDPSDYVYICYRTDSASVINVGSTDHLSGSVVQGLQLYNLAGESVKVSRRYSMDLRQTSISREEYNYWKEVKKQNESMGGLFDPMPTQTYGNIHRVGDPETVIGYFSGGQVAHKRAFFDFYSLADEILHIRRTHPCGFGTVHDVFLADIPSLPKNEMLVDPIRHPITNEILGFTVAYDSCVDCRKHGGTTIPPSFWPKDRF